MAYHDILRVGDSHPVHILLRQPDHRLIGQLRCVVLVERQRNVAYHIFLFGPCLALKIKAARHAPRVGRVHAVAGEQPSARFVHRVFDRAFETLARYDFTDHSSCRFENTPGFARPILRKTSTAYPTGLRPAGCFSSYWRSGPIGSGCFPAGRVRLRRPALRAGYAGAAVR